MRQKWNLMLVAMMLFSSIASAQTVTNDSIKVLKNDKEMLKIAKKINEQKLELVKLQNEVADKTQDVQKTAEESQKSASENEEAARKLSGDDQDKQKSKSEKKPLLMLKKMHQGHVRPRIN